MKSGAKVSWYFGDLESLKNDVQRHYPSFQLVNIGITPKLAWIEKSEHDSYMAIISLNTAIDYKVPIIGKHNLIISVFSCFDHKIKDTMEGIEEKVGIKLRNCPAPIEKNFKDLADISELLKYSPDISQ